MFDAHQTSFASSLKQAPPRQISCDRLRFDGFPIDDYQVSGRGGWREKWICALAIPNV
jgi:hypothetical protein